jgi:hypothetical protein
LRVVEDPSSARRPGMAQASERPRRKRLSWESRCEIVWRIEQGMSPPLAAASGGASRATG